MKPIEEIEAAALHLRAELAKNEAAVKVADETRDYTTYNAQTALARIHRQRLWALDWVLGNIEDNG
jgi:hypothetical protein